MSINFKKGIVFTICISIYSFFSLSAMGASFDCSKAFTSTEKMICSNDVLSNLDSSMALLYKEKKDKDLIKSQRDWLKNVRNKASNVDELIIEYSNRIKYLANYKPSKSKNSNTTSSIHPKAKEENSTSNTTSKISPEITDYANDFVIIEGVPYSTTRRDTNTVGSIMRCAELLMIDMMRIMRKRAEDENLLKEYAQYKDRIYTALWNSTIDKLERDIDKPEVALMCTFIIEGTRARGIY